MIRWKTQTFRFVSRMLELGSSNAADFYHAMERLYIFRIVETVQQALYWLSYLSYMGIVLFFAHSFQCVFELRIRALVLVHCALLEIVSI